MTQPVNPVFYDCEASGVDGVPIEIGWAIVEEDGGEIVSESHLVKPPKSWCIEARWDPCAEALHGIALVQLASQGRLPFEIARRMNAALAGRELFSDSPMDEAWTRQLFDEAGEDPAFLLRRTDANIVIAAFARSQGVGDAALAEVRKEAERRSPRTHRAEADARFWAELWLMLSTKGSPA
ncbi:MAG TPA: hypothetical protein VII49_00240 [Rhizomicrobium sp.]